MRLLVTRPEPEAQALADELHALGHAPVLQPLLQFAVLDFDPAPLGSADALILTSGNSLRALCTTPGFGEFLDRPLFCAGTETARRAREAGFKSVAATADTAEELAAKIVQAVEKGSSLVHVTGEHQAYDLAAALAREGLSVSTLRVYGMKARDALESRIVEEVKAGAIGGVILMSPRTAEIFVSLCRRHGLLDYAKGLSYFCLAGSIARQLEPAGAVHVFIAAKPNRDALLALIAALPTPGHDPEG